MRDVDFMQILNGFYPSSLKADKFSSRTHIYYD